MWRSFTKTQFNTRLFLVLALIALAVISRWTPHISNLTPVLAIALFSGMYISNKFLAFMIPTLTLIISDFVLGFYSGPLMLSVYASYVLIVGVGVLSKGPFKPFRLLGTSISSAIIFFLITNFAVWLLANSVTDGVVYEKSWSGLWKCYVIALPFFRATLLSTVIMSFALVGTYEFTTRKILAESKNS